MLNYQRVTCEKSMSFSFRLEIFSKESHTWDCPLLNSSRGLANNPIPLTFNTPGVSHSLVGTCSTKLCQFRGCHGRQISQASAIFFSTVDGNRLTHGLMAQSPSLVRSRCDDVRRATLLILLEIVLRSSRMEHLLSSQSRLHIKIHVNFGLTSALLQMIPDTTSKPWSTALTPWMLILQTQQVVLEETGQFGCCHLELFLGRNTQPCVSSK